MKTIIKLFIFVIFLASEQILSAQPSVFSPRGIGGGGALYFPSVNPANDNEFYVSCDMSELFHSTDFGLTYSQVDFSKLQVFSTSTYEFTSNPDIAYSNFNDGNEGYPVKTIDGGSTWIRMTGYNMGTYGHVYSMKANYNNPSQLLIGAYGDILFSANGGTSFSLVRHTANMGAGLIIGGVFWDDPYIYIGTNEGIIISSNSGASFSVMTTSGIAAGQVPWSFAGAKSVGNTRFCCITANVGDVYNGLMPWDYYNFAKGVYVMDNANGTWISKSTGINFSTDFVMYAAMAGNDINTIYLGGHDYALSAPLVLKSLDGGTTWADLHIFSHPVFWLSIDPNDQNRMYASVVHFGGTQGSQLGGIYRTNDLNNLAGATWTKLPNPPRTEGHPSCIEVLNDGKVVCTFSGRMNPGGAFTASSGVFLYDPALDSWSDVSDNGMYYWTMDIIIDPNDASQNTWYVCVFSGWGGPPNGLGGLYKTTNRGASWTKLTGSQFDRVASITFNPQNLHQAYLTTEMQGLWISNDMNNAIPSWTLVPSYPFRQPERVFFNPYDQNELWVTSFGNGMKVGNLNSMGISEFNDNNSAEFQLYPNPNNGHFILSSSAAFYDNGLKIFDIKGRIVFQQDLTPGNNKEIIDIPGLQNGIYFWEVVSGQNIAGSGKLEIAR